MLNAIYEQDFLDCSYEYRSRRNPHMALKALRDQVVKGKVRHVYELCRLNSGPGIFYKRW